VAPADTRRRLALGTAIAAVATAGSLWFSLGLGLVPCTLCWYQRILMYPLVVVLGVAALDRRPDVYRTALPLALPGLGLAAYHSVLQATTARCTLAGPCAAVQWRAPVVGLTIPNLSLLAFSLLTLLLVATWLDGR
jgi:disulfide bond formation protein DsbB